MQKMNKLVDDFLTHLMRVRKVSPLTVRNYRHYLERFLSWLAQITPKIENPAEINLQIIKQYKLFLSQIIDEHGIPLKHITQNYHLIALRTWLRYLAIHHIKAFSASDIQLTPTKSEAFKTLNASQLTELFEQPDLNTVFGLRDRAILELLFSTGLRVAELVGLNRQQINLKKNEISTAGKGGRVRTVYITETAGKWLSEYISYRQDKYQPLFVRYSGKKVLKGQGEEGLRLTTRSIQRIVEKYVKKAHLLVKITPQGLRHSFAKHLLASGTKLEAAQEILGHKNVSTTQMYSKNNGRTKIKKI